MFERFTGGARRIVVLAQEAARIQNQPDIGTFAVLAGCLRQEEGVAARVLAAAGVTDDAVLAQIGTGSTPTHGHFPFTPDAKKALELALREALQLGHNYIGPEHILLALVRDPGSPVALFLAGYGDDGWVKAAVVEQLRAARPQPSTRWSVTGTALTGSDRVAVEYTSGVKEGVRRPLALDITDALAFLDSVEAAWAEKVEKPIAEFRAALAETRRRLSPPDETPAAEA